MTTYQVKNVYLDGQKYYRVSEVGSLTFDDIPAENWEGWLEINDNPKILPWKDGSQYYHHKPELVRGYAADESGILSIIDVILVDGQPCYKTGAPMATDGKIVELAGWPDSKAESFEDGTVLIGLR